MNADWTPQTAEEQAKEEGIALGEKHWRVITSSRELAARDGRTPSLVEVTTMCNVTLAEVKTLFPGEAEEVLARIAGAPELKRKTS
jgi:sulfur relay (sulfurtransferase) DsrC/TusE family protein